MPSIHSEDLFGEAFESFQKGERCDDFTVLIDGEIQDPLPVAYFFRSVDEMPDLERFALDILEGKILDVGAAAGCHSLVLQDYTDVTALEISPKACEVMSMRGVKQVVNADFFKFNTGGFDTVLFLMNGLGIGRDAAGTIALLKHAKSLLSAEGYILGDSSDISYFKEKDTKKGDELVSPSTYFGIVEFELQWQGKKMLFPWIYPDPSFLEKCALEAGLHMSIVAEGPHFDYLVRFDHL